MNTKQLLVILYAKRRDNNDPEDQVIREEQVAIHDYTRAGAPRGWGCDDEVRTFFDRPSDSYDEALPVGTGRLGAMVSGAVAERPIWINEETAWYGGPRNRINPDALSHIGKIKKLVQAGCIREAEQLAMLTLTGTPESQRHYTTLGMVFLSFSNHEGVVDGYAHRLDFASATTSTCYSINGVSYEMQVHANQPESALIIRLKASAPVLDFYAGIERGERVNQFSYGTHQDEVIRHAQNGVIMLGSCGGRLGPEFAGALFAQSDGMTAVLGDKVVIKGASEAVLYVTASTSYGRVDHVIDHVVEQAISARNKGYSVCYRNHLDEWTPLYNRVVIDLDTTRRIGLLPLNRLFESVAKGDRALPGFEWQGRSSQEMQDAMVLLLFHFGRYILLSCSRKCELPASLQGLWCRDLLPIWDGKFTTNINLQMAYWPADSTNLRECFEPYICLAERIRLNGLMTAKRMYNCRGFVLHNNTDIWADTAVQDSGPHCSYWFVGSDGTILEWATEAREVDPAHRHSSHVIGAYPYNGITEQQPELYEAVLKSVEKRRKNGGYNTGWGYAWGAGLLARFKRGDEARDMLFELLQHSSQPNLFSCCNIRMVPKLMENNKPLQVDGTIGLIQSVVELLLQSHNDDEVQILPALPVSWADGSFEGLVARGNIVIDARWQGGKLIEAVLRPQVTLKTTIICHDEFTLTTPTGQISSIGCKVTVRLEAGTSCRILPGNSIK